MLYNGCIRFIKKAQLSVEQEQIVEKHENIVRAQNILEELQSTLNMDYEISQNLYSMYEYMHHLLTQADIKNDHNHLDECLQLLTELRDTWGEALKQLKATSQVSI